MAEGRSASGADLLARIGREISERLVLLRQAVDEHQQLLDAFAALESPAAEPEQPAPAPAKAPKPVKRRTPVKPREQSVGAPELAILAALEHGSHTVAELGVVTAMSGGEIREGARRLLRAGRIVRASREGRAAYALVGSE
jgi:hypothetical protein